MHKVILSENRKQANIVKLMKCWEKQRLERLDIDNWFWGNAIPVTESGCLIWLGKSHIKHGYSQVTFQGQRTLVHRFAWCLTYGDIPQGLHVLHSCDVTSCINPQHLFLGTHQDNMTDMDKKGRRAPPRRGEMNNKNKLTTSQIVEIMNSVETDLSLSRQYGVSRATIWDIRHRKSWNHIDIPINASNKYYQSRTLIAYDGKSMTLYGWAKYLNINHDTLSARTRRG